MQLNSVIHPGVKRIYLYGDLTQIGKVDMSQSSGLRN